MNYWCLCSFNFWASASWPWNFLLVVRANFRRVLHDCRPRTKDITFLGHLEPHLCIHAADHVRFSLASFHFDVNITVDLGVFDYEHFCWCYRRGVSHGHASTGSRHFPHPIPHLAPSWSFTFNLALFEAVIGNARIRCVLAALQYSPSSGE